MASAAACCSSRLVLSHQPNCSSSSGLPVKVSGSWGNNSYTQQDLHIIQNGPQESRPARWISSRSLVSPLSPLPPTNQRRKDVNLFKIENYSHCGGGITSRANNFVGVSYITPKLRRVTAWPQQHDQWFRREEDGIWRLQSSSGRSSRCLRIFCRPAQKESSADFILPTGAPSRPTLDSSQKGVNAYQSDKLKFWVITVSTSDELLAAATLRAQLFYTYPKFTPTGSDEGLEGIKARLRHEFHVQNLLKSRVKSEFERDVKMQELNMNVKCLLAVCEAANHNELLLSAKDKSISLNSLMTLPALHCPAFSRKPLVAIGTLDMQDGRGSTASVDVNTVTFQLLNNAQAQKMENSNGRENSGKRTGHRLLASSTTGEIQINHGYIFNLCVIETARRQGVATALMKEAVRVARQMQLEILYVHVEAHNNSGLALYQKLGYVVEEEEPLDVEKRFTRPRRILLSFRHNDLRD